MTVRRVNQDTGDIATSGVQFITEREEIAQVIGNRLKLFFAEYFRDITDGTPWYQSVLGKGSPLSVKDSVIKNRIIQTEGVTSILEFNADYDINNRSYSIAAKILTIYGEVGFSTNNNVHI